MCTSSQIIHKVLGLKNRAPDPILTHSGTVHTHSGTVHTHSGTVHTHSGTVHTHSGTVHTQHVHLVYTDNAFIFTSIFMSVKCPS